MTLHRDTLSSLILCGVAIAYACGARGFPYGRGEPGPAFFPALLAGALLVLAVTILVRGWRMGAHDGRDPHGPRGDRHRLGVVGLGVGATVSYVALFAPLGFAVSTWAYTLALSMLFGRRRLVHLLVIPALSTSFIYVLFVVGLGARMPPGWWIAP